jgi:hypothetical protein
MTIGYDNINEITATKYQTSDIKSPFDYKYYYSKAELMEILKEYYGGGKIPLISKLKNKRQIVQRIMSL